MTLFFCPLPFHNALSHSISSYLIPSDPIPFNLVLTLLIPFRPIPPHAILLNPIRYRFTQFIPYHPIPRHLTYPNPSHITSYFPTPHIHSPTIIPFSIHFHLMPSCTPTTLSHSFQSHPPYLLPSYYIPYHLIPSHSTLSSIISHDMILHHPIPRRLTRSEPSSHHIRPPHSTPLHHPSLSAYSIPFHVISHPPLYPTSCHPKLPTPYHPICSRTTPPYHYLYPIRCYLTQLYTTTPYSTPSCLISAHFTSQHTSPLHPIMPPHPIHSHFMSSNTNHYIPPISSNIPPPPSPRPIPFNRLLPHSIPFLHFQSHSIPYHISNSLHHVLFHVTALRLIPPERMPLHIPHHIPSHSIPYHSNSSPLTQSH